MSLKSKLLTLALVGLLLLGSAKPEKLVRLTIINKGDLPLGLRFQNQEDVLSFYYLTIQPGSKEIPTVQTFTVRTAVYNLTVQYIEYWDPVYGFQCNSIAMRDLAIFSNTRLVFLPCNQMPPNLGERTMEKVWPFRIRFRF